MEPPFEERLAELVNREIEDAGDLDTIAGILAIAATDVIQAGRVDPSWLRPGPLSES